MTTFRKELPPNLAGIDYYIGDLHGQRDLFDKLLAEIKFDPEKDRIISVGDLVDRGPKSYECLTLLREPWFHTVLSNHEQMMLFAFNYDEPWSNKLLANSWIGNGGHWGLGALGYKINKNAPLPSEQDIDIITLVQENVMQLPRILNVKQADGSYIHVVHAELPPYIETTRANLLDDEWIKGYTDPSVHVQGDIFAWGRYRFASLYARKVNKHNVDMVLRQMNYNKASFGSCEDLVISGHTIVTQPTQIDNFLNLDTGAYASESNWSGLSCYNSKSGTVTKVSSTGISFPSIFKINSKDILNTTHFKQG